MHAGLDWNVHSACGGREREYEHERGRGCVFGHKVITLIYRQGEDARGQYTAIWGSEDGGIWSIGARMTDGQ